MTQLILNKNDDEKEGEKIEGSALSRPDYGATYFEELFSKPVPHGEPGDRAVHPRVEVTLTIFHLVKSYHLTSMQKHGNNRLENHDIPI